MSERILKTGLRAGHVSIVSSSQISVLTLLVLSNEYVHHAADGRL
ncbi:MAG: hypothetical protein PHV03_11480 [Desulfitobacteriaceae bacterium]|nr:hypothetical protein [Desulfitobacteriaceae bacterium]